MQTSSLIVAGRTLYSFRAESLALFGVRRGMLLEGSERLSLARLEGRDLCAGLLDQIGDVTLCSSRRKLARALSSA